LKDQYVGDINDFAKYQLLRLCGKHFERVIVSWMLTGADGRSDGGRTGYLREIARGAADPELFEILAELVEGDRRALSAVEASEALPGCLFHSDAMPAGPERATYFQSLAELADQDSLIFLDPDNGFEVASVAKSAGNAERYLYWDELAVLRDTGSSVLVYQHFPRVDRVEYLDRLTSRLEQELGEGYRTFAAHTSQVAFLFGVREERAASVAQAVADRCRAEPLLAFAG